MTISWRSGSCVYYTDRKEEGAIAELIIIIIIISGNLANFKYYSDIETGKTYFES